jgi:nucleoside-diphosphate-sugar epimerase
MNCLVTGASGFLGRALVARLAREHDIVGLCHKNPAQGLVACDIRDSRAFASVVKEHAPEVVIHSAAYRDPDYAEDHPEENHRLNVVPARVLRHNTSTFADIRTTKGRPTTRHPALI